MSRRQPSVNNLSEYAPWFTWPRGGVTRSIFMSETSKTINQAVTSMNAFSSLAVEEHQPTVSGELFMRPK